MRYAIGCSIIDKKTLKPVEGIYIESRYGAYVCSPETNDTSKSHVLIFNDVEYAIRYANKLSKTYKAEFDYRAKARNLDRDKFRFYPVKVDSDKFPLKLLKKTGSGGKPCDQGYLNWETWDFEKK